MVNQTTKYELERVSYNRKLWLSVFLLACNHQVLLVRIVVIVA